MRSARALLLVLVGMLLLSACRIDATVAVRVREDGSGTVRVRVVLDPDAVGAAESGASDLDGIVRLDDLPAAGWRVEPWVRRVDGSAVLAVRREFASPEQFETVMAELNGSGGPLRRVRLRRGSGPVRTTFDFRALADLGVIESGVASDQQLAASLSGQGVDVAGLDAAFTARLRDALRMNVAVALPGDGTRVWHLPPGARALLETSSSQFDLLRLASLGLGLVLVAVALALVLSGARWRRSSRRRAGP